ncbi:MAG: hypothetical protein IPG77_16300 [Betaproteobacteria bacterium]|nr:hypothetical protein [Betaproteobacteria bacterium]
MLYNLGIAYSTELGQFDEAIIRLKRAVQLDPGPRPRLGGIDGKYHRAAGSRFKLVEKAVEANPMTAIRAATWAASDRLKRIDEAVTPSPPSWN